MYFMITILKVAEIWGSNIKKYTKTHKTIRNWSESPKFVSYIQRKHLYIRSLVIIKSKCVFTGSFFSPNMKSSGQLMLSSLIDSFPKVLWRRKTYLFRYQKVLEMCQVTRITTTSNNKNFSQVSKILVVPLTSECGGLLETFRPACASRHNRSLVQCPT